MADFVHPSYNRIIYIVYLRDGQNFREVINIEEKIDIYALLSKGTEKDEELFKNAKKIAEGELLTYKELCEILNQKRVGGNQKTSQLKEFSRFFDFEYDKEIKRYVIKEIYSSPLPPKSKSPANTKYADHIKVLLLSYLIKHKNINPGGAVYISYQRLYKALGIVNHQYIEMQHPDKKKVLKESIRQNLEEKEYNIVNLEDKTLSYYINNFYYRCGSKFSSIINTVLDTLENQNYITHSKSYGLYKAEFNDDNEIINIKYENSTDRETEDLLDIEREIMDEFGFKNDQDIWYGGKTEEYWEMVLEEVQTIYPEIHRLYRCHKIIGTKNNLLKALSRTEETEEMHELNKKIIEYIDKQAENNMYKYIEESGNRLSNRYVDAQKYLSDRLIKIRE